MTYDASEKSRYAGQPVECYRFTQGGNIWRVTSADREITLPVGVFEPEAITRGEFDFSQEDSGETLEITVPREHPVAALFIADLPSTAVGVTVYRAHRGGEADAITFFAGRVISARFEGSEAVLTAASLVAALRRQVPTLAMQAHCNHVLYSAGCGADRLTATDSVTVTTVTGSTVTSNDFALRADGWYNAGRLVSPTGESRMIVDHVGDTVTLISPVPGLESLMVCQAEWGCDHLETTCAAKFNNLVNHLGWSRLPLRNPFKGRID